MDTILLTVTALSLAMAIGMALVVVKLLHQERARSEARVAALSVLASDEIASTPRAASPLSRRVPVTKPHPTQPHARRAVQVDDLEIRPAEDRAVAGVAELFTQTETHSPWGRRLAVIASLGAVLAVIGFALVSGVQGPPAASAGSSQAGSSSAAPTAVVEGMPLELLSLHHEHDAQRLVISGIVQNPRNGTALTRVVATAFVFGPDGSFVTSARAPLDFTTLAPGVESPFVVSVPVSGTVTRYRIGFRTDDGRVISHVDRRGPDALAQK